MGRAIDMENDIDKLKVKVEKLENQVRGMISKIDEISEKSSKTKHIDLVEDVGAEIEDNKKEKDGKKKTDNEGDAKSSKQPDSKSGKSNKRVYNIEFIIDNYHEWKNEKDEFKQYVLDVVEKSAKDGANSNVSSK